MRYFLLFISVIAFSQAFSQPNCLKNSKLYYFDPYSSPRVFTEKLGHHPEFEFLQKIHGVTTVQQFIDAINNPDNQQTYSREFIAFDLLLRNSGFTNGYKDVVDSSVEDVYVKRGTIGNLGFYDKQKDHISYIYVKLYPAGEDKEGVAAWKLTNAHGCYLYILHTCGNAFYPNDSPKGSGLSRSKNTNAGNKTVSVEAYVKPLEIQSDTFRRTLHVGINFYQASLIRSRKSKSGYDTSVKLIRHVDTVTSFKDRDGRFLKIYANSIATKLLVTKDTSLTLFTPLKVDSSSASPDHDAVNFVFSDTTYVEYKKTDTIVCKNKWEITLDGGASFNTIPRFDDATEHSQTNGANLAAELTISQMFTPWFQVGISASYLTLSYQDDILYTGTVPGTYNKVYLGKPIIPIQLFGKFNIGKQIGWQSSLSLSVGYSLPMKGKIVNSGTTLTTDPGLQGAPTAGLKLGINYFFTCKFGLGVACGGQYFGNKGATMNYSLFAFPITAGLRFRF